MAPLGHDQGSAEERYCAAGYSTGVLLLKQGRVVTFPYLVDALASAAERVEMDVLAEYCKAGRRLTLGAWCRASGLILRACRA